MDKNHEEQLAKTFDEMNKILGDVPFLTTVVLCLGSNGEAVDYPGGVYANKLSSVDADSDAVTMIAVLLRSLMLFCQDSVADDRGDELFEAALQEAKGMYQEFAGETPSGRQFHKLSTDQDSIIQKLREALNEDDEDKREDTDD